MHSLETRLFLCNRGGFSALAALSKSPIIIIFLCQPVSSSAKLFYIIYLKNIYNNVFLVQTTTAIWSFYLAKVSDSKRIFYFQRQLLLPCMWRSRGFHMELIVKFSLVETGVLGARVTETSQSQSTASMTTRVSALGLTGHVGSSQNVLRFK